jgi:hypothetical protein
MFIPFYLLKTSIRNLIYSLFFSPSHLAWRVGETPISTWIGARRRNADINLLYSLFCQVSVFAKLVCQTVGCQIFLFLPKFFYNSGRTLHTQHHTHTARTHTCASCAHTIEIGGSKASVYGNAQYH